MDHKAGPLPLTVTYNSEGGTLVIWFSGSMMFGVNASRTLSFTILIDNVKKGQYITNIYAESLYTPFTMPTQVITGISAGNRQMKFTMSTPQDLTNNTCWYYATVLELPF